MIGNVGWILRDQSWRIIKELQDEGHDSREGYVLCILNYLVYGLPDLYYYYFL